MQGEMTLLALSQVVHTDSLLEKDSSSHAEAFSHSALWAAMYCVVGFGTVGIIMAMRTNSEDAIEASRRA